MKVKTAIVGGIVQSTQGRDRGNFYLIVAIENEIIYVVDGRKRQLTTPKKKNIKHLELLPIFHPEIIERVAQGKNENTQIQIAIQNVIEKRKVKNL